MCITNLQSLDYYFMSTILYGMISGMYTGIPITYCNINET